MRVLNIKELEKHDIKALANLYQTVDSWVSSQWITKDEKNSLITSLKSLNVKHRSEDDFEYRLVQLFSIDDKDKFVPQTIDRHHIGGHFAAMEFDSKITLFIESLEMGVIILVNPETINKDNVRSLLLGVNKIIQGINSPEETKKEMQFLKLEKELPETSQNIKKLKI